MLADELQTPFKSEKMAKRKNQQRKAVKAKPAADDVPSKRRKLQESASSGDDSAKSCGVAEESAQGKTRTAKPTKTGAKKKLDVPPPDPALLSGNNLKSRALPRREENGDLVFDDWPDFVPNLTPKEVLQAGSFGGTYFRDIYSSVLGEQCKDAWKELPEDWLEGLDLKTQVYSQTYRPELNKYKAKCGGDLQMWEESGWIKKQDPYGWFQWYCRFYQGRRTKDDERQIGRWSRCAGAKGRWRSNLITKIYKSGRSYTDGSVSPVVRQVLLHWAYTLTEPHYQQGVKAVIKRLGK